MYLGLAAVFLATNAVAATPVIDGRLQPNEWRGAAQVSMTGGGEVWILRAGRDLYVAVLGATRGYPSLCVGGSRRVDILHASAALGTVTYLRSGRTWHLQGPFVWRARDHDVSASIMSTERSAFFRRYGWLSTSSENDASVREFHVELTPTARWLGVVFLNKATMHTAYWPATMGAACRDLALVKGDAPATLDFQPASWYPVE